MSDDTIYRQAAIDAVISLCDNCDSGYCGSCRVNYPGEKDAKKVLEDLPSVRQEQSDTSEFWRKRADYYSDLCMRLIAEMGKGVKIESVKISENGIEFIKEQPPAQPEQTDCIYCHEDSDGYVKPIEKNCHAFISFGMDEWELSLKANGWHGSAKIRYCPMCGRRLKR